MSLRRLSDRDLRHILESAILAPSADNRLAIRFHIADEAIAVHFAGAAYPLTGGYRELLLLLSLGALIENAVIAASTIGVELAVELPQRIDPGAPLARLVPTDKPVDVDPLHAQLERRHTNRRVVYRGPALTPVEQDAVARSAVGTSSTCQLVWIEKQARAAVIRQMTRAETERFRNRALHEELFSAIRFDVGWKTGCAEGLPPGALQVELPARPLFQAYRHWGVARLANRLGAHHVFGLRSCWLPCKLAPDLGAITVDSLDPLSLLGAGRGFQRTWLELTRLGRALQPLPAAALYALPPAHQEDIAESLQHAVMHAWRARFGGRYPVMFFRCGKAENGPIHAMRHPLTHYLEPSKQGITASV